MGLYSRVGRRVGAFRTTLRSATVLLALAVATSAMAGWGPFDAGQDGDSFTEMAAGSTTSSPPDGARTTDTTADSTMPSAPAPADGSRTRKTKTDTRPNTGTNTAVGSTTSSTPGPIVAPTERASEALRLEPPGPGCVNGWTTPSPGTAQRQEPLDVIRDTMGITDKFDVSEMRYFTGPEAPSATLAPGQPFVEHWYVKASLVDEASFRARWIVTKRNAGEAAVAAVAPYETSGFQSPDWRAFERVDGPPGEEPTRFAVPGVPGLWSGDEYDFVTGPSGSDRGLPQETEGCLDGT